MSTKTTFKRVALVAVAAMGFGLLSVAPSSAAHVFQADALSLSAATSTVAVGSSTTITVTQSFLAGATLETMTVTSSFTSVPSGATVAELPTPTFSSGSNSFASFSTKVVNVGAAVSSLGVSNTSTMTFAPTKVGTYVIKFTPEAATTTDVINSTAQTWTVTVTALATAAAADATSTMKLTKGIVTTGSAESVSTGLAVGSSVATILVTPLVALAATTGSTVITATITGPGTLGLGTSAPATSTGRSITAGFAPGAIIVSVWADGTSGTSTITITLGSLVLGTKTVSFYGAVASYTSTVTKPVITSGSGATAVNAVSTVAKDANGTVVPGAAVFFASGTSTVFASSASVTADVDGVALFAPLGLVAGTSTVTAQNVAAGSTATISAAAVSLRAGSNIASSVAMTLDKATYSQGEAAVLTVTIKDAAGSLVADGTHAAFSVAPTSTRAVTGNLPTTSIVTTGSANGTFTYKFNVPTTSGAFTISGLGGSGLAAAQADLAVSVTATVSQTAAEIANADAIAAAADAAAEATDAANAATDAANAAAEAADAATAAAQDAADAVAALGAQVAELIDGLKAQIAAQKAAITALTNLVIKIQKKLKA